MKKVLKITGIALCAVILIMALLPLMFRGKIKQIVVREGNKMIDARFDFGKLGVSLFRNFPNVSASLNDFYMVGVDRFRRDTLVRVDRLSLTIDLASLCGDGPIEVKRVNIEHALFNAIVLEDGRANWDIMKEQQVEEKTDTTSSSMSIKLDRLTIKDMSIAYDDRSTKSSASVGKLNASLSGDLGASHTNIELIAMASGIKYTMDGISYLNGADFAANADVDADLEQMLFTLKENIFKLNAIQANIDGWVKAPEESVEMDLKLSTPDIQFKDILSLVPAIYAKDFENVETSGKVKLQGWAKGTMVGELLPAFAFDMTVADAMFRYPSLPKSVDNINLVAEIRNPGGVADMTSVNVQNLAFTMAGNPFRMAIALSTPVSDPAFDASAHGVIDLGMVKDVYPLDSMQLNGMVNADVTLSGRMSHIEKEQYEQIKAAGTVTLSGMKLQMADMPEVDVKNSVLTFTPRYLDLSQTNVQIGRNDLQLDSRIENYIAYALQDKTLKGTLNLRSSYLNINELMGKDTPTEASADTSAMSVIEVPRNLDLAIAANLDKVIYDNLTLDKVAGNIIVREGRLEMKNLAMNTLAGNVKMNGTYSTAKSVDQPEFGADFAMNGLSFAETFKSFVTIQKIVPLFENLSGNFSGNISLNTVMDKTMTPVLTSLNGKGNLSTKDLSLASVGVIGQILDMAKIAGVTDRKVKDLKIDFSITDGRVKTNPFDIKMGDASINLSGTTGIDRSIDYTGKVQLPPAISAATRMQSVDLKIGGDFSSPKVNIDFKNAATQAVQSVVNEALGSVGQKLGLDLSDAQKQKEALVLKAQEGGEMIMKEVRKQADDITSKAGKDPISQLAARKVADRMIVQAQTRVDAMIAKAVAQGDSIIGAAKKGE